MKRETAIHGVVGDVSGRLARAGAPADLVAAARGTPIDTLWSDCGRADWLLWLAVAEKVPLVAMLDAAAACVRLAVDAQTGELRAMKRALRAVDEATSVEACRRAAKACEALAGPREPGGYRAAPGSSLSSGARAAAYLARAAEALLGAEARRVAAREAEGRARAAGIGVGDHIMWRADFPPLAYDLDDDLLVSCFAALEGAVEAATGALVTLESTPEAIAEATEELADAAFEVLDPVRRAILRGHDVGGVVRSLAVRPYVESKDLVDNPKKRVVAVAAAIIFPFGGGHYHADRFDAGLLFTLGAVALLFTPTKLAWPLLVFADAYLASRAIDRQNRGETEKPGAHVRLVAAVVAACHAIAFVVG